MKAVYDGSLYWVIWENISHPNIAGYYGKGEFCYYCKKEDAIFPESELSDLSAESRESCEKEPCEIGFYFENIEEITAKLLDSINRANRLIAPKKEEYRKIFEKHQPFFKADFFENMEEWVSSKNIDESYLEIAEPILKDMHDYIQEQGNRCDVFAEIYMGLLIQEAILRNKTCYFTIDCCFTTEI